MINCIMELVKKLVLSYELAWRTEDDKKFMKTTEWKKIRAEILERDSYTCQYCGIQRKDQDQGIPGARAGGADLGVLGAGACPANSALGNYCGGGGVSRGGDDTAAGELATGEG